MRERSETSGGSLGEEYVLTSHLTTANNACELPLPPRGRDLSHVHAACDPFREYINCSPPQENESRDNRTDIESKSTIVKQETVAEVHNSNDNIKIFSDRKPEIKITENVGIEVNEGDRIRQADDEEDPLQPLEDLALSSDSSSRLNDADSSTLTLNSAHLSHLSSSDLELLEQSQKLLKSVADSLQESEPLLTSPEVDYKAARYINVSPFPPLPLRHKYKSVLL